MGGVCHSGPRRGKLPALNDSVTRFFKILDEEPGVL